jgi:serine/threonine-protein kinase
MAPEQAGGQPKAVGAAADVYALGAILYEMLTGRPPFRGETAMDTVLQVRYDEPVPPRRLQPKVPRDLETICLKCLRKEPAQRYASALALAEDLRRFLAGEPVQARPVGTGERLARWCRRNPVVAGLVATWTVVVPAALVVVTFLWLRADRLRQVADGKQREAEDNLAAANENLVLARDAVDRNLTAVSQSPQLQRPGLQPLRRELLQAALGYYQRFIHQHADAPGIRADLAKSYVRVGEITQLIGSRPEALAAFEQAAAAFEAFLQEGSLDSAGQDQLARVYLKIGHLHLELGDRKAAVRSLERGLAVQERLLGTEPVNASFQETLAGLHGDLGQTWTVAGNYAAAREAYERSRAIKEQLVKANPSAAGYRVTLARDYSNLGSLLINHKRDPKAAIPFYERACAEAWAGVKLSSDGDKYRPGLVKYQNNLGLAHMQAGASAAALEAYQQALDVVTPLAAANPAVTEYQELLAKTYHDSATLQDAVKDFEGALRGYDRAEPIWKQLIRLNPNVVEYHSGLANTYGNRGMTFSKMKRTEEALTWFQRTLAEQRIAFDKLPQSPVYRQHVGDAYYNIGIMLRRLGRPKEAAEAARERLKLWPNNPQELYDTADEFAQCIPLVGKGPAGGDEALREEYSRDAVRALEQAVAAGYTNWSAANKNENFDPIRGREDFQRVLRQLEEKAKATGKQAGAPGP